MVVAFSLLAHIGQPQAIVTLSQESRDWWGVQVLANGRVFEHDLSTLGVDLSNLTLQANPKYPKDRPIGQVKVCLGQPLPKKSWTTVTCSEAKGLDLNISSGSSVELHDLRFLVPVPAHSKIASYYLVLTIESLDDSGKIVSYHAKSEGDPLQDLQDQLLQARR